MTTHLNSREAYKSRHGWLVLYPSVATVRLVLVIYGGGADKYDASSRCKEWPCGQLSIDITDNTRRLGTAVSCEVSSGRLVMNECLLMDFIPADSFSNSSHTVSDPAVHVPMAHTILKSRASLADSSEPYAWCQRGTLHIGELILLNLTTAT
ncbi:hypothetical protein AcW1_007830 [Taiwanofungus camphoratus]|nr:hypothetical protein AcW1_007830 [Antrodia cinnamomea]